ncbi:hypothetical protein C8J57DRAFT_1230307 [Mycena rebaudengoi]|nr:hypothetical protein C8J57DRAFT_1230307 [Mycena rebaudengoi]
MLYGDKFTTSALVHQGLIPCAPFSPTFAVASRVLEMFRLARIRCLTLSIDSWVKTLHDLHGSAFRPYCGACACHKAIGCDEADSRMKTCCPACTYKLEGEADLVFSMLVTMDGNDLLKRILRKDRHIYDDDGIQQHGANERVDPWTESAGGSYFLSHKKVDMVKVPDPEQASMCEERWKSLSEDLMSKMWGIFDETRVFVVLCRHGFTLLLADMVCSGELAKYPLAMVDALLDVFGPKLGAGYDIGCGFETMIKNNPLGPQAKAMQLKCLMGEFHGHAHNRKCQLEYLVNYVPGMGLEDLGRDTIATWLAHHDTFEIYANLSKFLVNNYYQVITVLNTEDSLKFTMEQQGIQDVLEFPWRLAKELELLVNLKTQKENFNNVCSEGSTSSATVRCHAQEAYDKAVEEMQATEARLTIEASRFEVHEMVENCLVYQNGKSPWWSEGDPAWVEAATLVSKQRFYHKAVNRLEELVVKRMFELTKMNMSQTGYKMRKHIATALQTRSKAIQNALKNYNLATAALSSPTRRLELAEAFFIEKENTIRESDPALAFFVQRHQFEWERFDIVHMDHLKKLQKKLGARFTGTLEPGVWLVQAITQPASMEGVEDTGREAAEKAAVDLAVWIESLAIDEDSDSEWEEYDGDYAEEEVCVVLAVYDVQRYQWYEVLKFASDQAEGISGIWGKKHEKFPRARTDTCGISMVCNLPTHLECIADSRPFALTIAAARIECRSPEPCGITTEPSGTSGSYVQT